MVVGWSRDKVAKYAALDAISPIAWKVIVTAFQNTVTIKENDVVTSNVTTVTERILRDILPLPYGGRNMISENNRRQ